MSQIEILKQSKEPEEDRSPTKALILFFLGIASSVGVFYFFTRFIISLTFFDFFGFFLSLVLFLILSSLIVVFIKSSKWLKIITGIISLAPLVFVFGNHLYPKTSYTLLTGGFIFLFFYLLGTSQGHRYLQNGLKFRFFKFLHQVFPKVFLGLLIFLMLILYFGYFELEFLDEELGQELVFSTLSRSEPVFNLWFGSISFTQNVDEFFENLARDKLKSSPPDARKEFIEEFGASFKELDPVLQSRILSEIIIDLKKEAEEAIGFSLDDNLTAREIVFAVLVNYLEELSDNAKTALSVVFIVAIFFVFRGIAFLLSLPVEILTFIIFKFLIFINFAHISEENTTREFVILS